MQKTTFPLKLKELNRVSDIKSVFNRINQHLYGKLKYTDTDTRSRSKEIINLLICKLVDEMTKSPGELVEFCILEGETRNKLTERIKIFFEKKVKNQYSNIIGSNETINLNVELIYLIVSELQSISLLKSSKDVFRDSFEQFVSKILKDEGGQFFTPSNVIKFIVEYLNPAPNERILDPACGHGGFLIECLRYIENHPNTRDQEPNNILNLYGIDKDKFLAKICKLYLAVLSGTIANIYCEDSLNPDSYRLEASQKVKNNLFDIILTNPPFGSKIPINDPNILKNYDLGHIWNYGGDSIWQHTERLCNKQPPQILFIERCVQLLREGGRMGIVLPEGIFGNSTLRYIWEFLKANGKILGIVSLDQNTFQPYTCNKTSILFFQKMNPVPANYYVDFAIVNHVGHDKDGKVLFKLNKDGTKLYDNFGNAIVHDDLVDLAERLKNAPDFNSMSSGQLFKMNSNLVKNNIFIPNYYLGVEKRLMDLSYNHDVVLTTLKELADEKILYTNKSGLFPRGDEIGSRVYGLGEIPFIRTSDISNWEVNLDSNKKTSREVFNLYKEKQNIEPGDILLVKDGGSNLIGKTAFVSELDKEIIIQSHIYQIKVLDNNEDIDPFLLLYLLNLEIVQTQIQAITFIQGTIATIGKRILDVVLPLPAKKSKRIEISNYIERIITSKIENKNKIRQLSIDLLTS